jgi:hypothetical protein
MVAQLPIYAEIAAITTTICISFQVIFLSTDFCQGAGMQQLLLAVHGAAAPLILTINLFAAYLGREITISCTTNPRISHVSRFALPCGARRRPGLRASCMQRQEQYQPQALQHHCCHLQHIATSCCIGCMVSIVGPSLVPTLRSAIAHAMMIILYRANLHCSTFCGGALFYHCARLECAALHLRASVYVLLLLIAKVTGKQQHETNSIKPPADISCSYSMWWGSAIKCQQQ